MKERIRNNVYMTVCGLLLYLGSVWLSRSYHLPSDIAFGCFFAAYLLAGYSVFQKIAEHFLEKIFLDGNVLLVITTICAFAVGYYVEAVAVILIFQVGHLIEMITIDRSKRRIRELIDVHAIPANKLVDGEEIQVEPSELEKDDRILIRPGERVPVDGIVVSGTTSLDTQMITGEAIPREEEPGGIVYSGSLNLTGAIEVKVLHTYDDSTVSRILNIVENVDMKKAESEHKVRRYIQIYVGLVLAAAAMLVVLPSLFDKTYEYVTGMKRVVVFLAAACPCAIGMSVSTAFLGGILSAAKKGVIVKGGVYLEILAKVNTFLFDKTGTLTEGVFEVQEVHAQWLTEEELLEIATYVESYSNHPIAVSLKNAYGKELEKTRMTEMEEIPGYGLTAIYEGKKVYVGNARLMEERGIRFQEIHKSGSVIYIAVDGKYAGYIVVSDMIKKDAKEMIMYLKKHCQAVTVMVTGDTQFTGKEVAEELELDYYYANQLPQDKVERLEEFLNMQDDTECLAAVGDGINDAPVLTRADVGIAMGALGSDAAIEAADIILMDDEPLALVDAVRIAKETLKVIRQNTVYAVLIKIIVLGLALCGMITIKGAIIWEVCVIVLAIVNAAWASKNPA
ncbi:putative uncharacterized protein [[Clostridium] nexile CAG:348]|nr:putative uncharacterized protein [[Clostridium] nexile CAG:348]